MKTGKKLAEWFLTVPDLFFPRVCASCHKSLFVHENIICTPCRIRLPETGFCEMEDNKVSQVFRGRVRLTHCSSFLYYRKGNQVQLLIHQLKYRGRTDIGEFLGGLYGRKLIHRPELEDVSAIVPVPLHPRKERLRGYNQSMSIALGLSESMHIPIRNDLAKRQHYNQSQTKKDRFARWENAQDKFILSKMDAMEGKHLLLVDDVITTGSTLESLSEIFQNIEGLRLSAVSLGISL